MRLFLYLLLTLPLNSQASSCITEEQKKECKRALAKLDGRMNAFIAAQIRYEKALENGDTKIKYIEVNANQVQRRYMEASKEVAKICSGDGNQNTKNIGAGIKPTPKKVQTLDDFIESIKNLGVKRQKPYN